MSGSIMPREEKAVVVESTPKENVVSEAVEKVVVDSDTESIVLTPPSSPPAKRAKYEEDKTEDKTDDVTENKCEKQSSPMEQSETNRNLNDSEDNDSHFTLKPVDSQDVSTRIQALKAKFVGHFVEFTNDVYHNIMCGPLFDPKNPNSRGAEISAKVRVKFEEFCAALLEENESEEKVGEKEEKEAGEAKESQEAKESEEATPKNQEAKTSTKLDLTLFTQELKPRLDDYLALNALEKGKLEGGFKGLSRKFLISDLNSAVMGVPNDKDSDLDFIIPVATVEEQAEIEKALTGGSDGGSDGLGYKYTGEFDETNTDLPWKNYQKFVDFGPSLKEIEIEVKVRGVGAANIVLIAHEGIKALSEKQKWVVAFVKSTLCGPIGNLSVENSSNADSIPFDKKTYKKFKYILYAAGFNGHEDSLIFRVGQTIQ